MWQFHFLPARSLALLWEVGLYLTNVHMTQCLGEFGQIDHLLHTSAGMAMIIHEWHLHNWSVKNWLLSTPSVKPSWPTQATLAWGEPSWTNIAVLQTQIPEPEHLCAKASEPWRDWTKGPRKDSVHYMEPPCSATSTAVLPLPPLRCHFIVFAIICTKITQADNSKNRITASFVSLSQWSPPLSPPSHPLISFRLSFGYLPPYL